MKDTVSNLFLNTLKYKVIIGIIAASIIALSFNKAFTNDLFLLEKNNNQSLKDNAKKSDAEEAFLYKIEKKNSLKRVNNKNLMHVSNTKEIKKPIVSNPSFKNNPHNQKTAKPEITETSDTTNNKQPKLIYIKKQIIKKDTIYVFK